MVEVLAEQVAQARTQSDEPAQVACDGGPDGRGSEGRGGAPTGSGLRRLVRGLGAEALHRRLRHGRRLGDVGQRMLAFYLLDMHERRAYQDFGCSSTAQYAERHLDLQRRRARALVQVGRALAALPAIDEAFATGHLTWSKVLLLARVATPPHEAAWLERARALGYVELDLLVRRSRAGAAPRAPGDRKGLPELRFPVRVDADTLTHQQWELARAKLAAERGDAVSDLDVLRVVTQVFLQLEADGSAPGYTPVSSSLYRVVLHGPSAGEGIAVDTGSGPVPIEGDDASSQALGAALRCDADHVTPDGPGAKDIKTPPALRQRILLRDGARCRHCGDRHELHVHHVVHREHGGPTIASNLVTVCLRCHALVHEGLLVAAGADAATLTFAPAADASRLLAQAGRHADAELPLEVDGAAPPAVRPEVPAVIDAAWWADHAHAIKARRDGALELRGEPRPMVACPSLEQPVPLEQVPLEQVPLEQAQAAHMCRLGGVQGPEDRDMALQGLTGLEPVAARLEAAAAGAQVRGRTFPHSLLVGPPGTGKTTLARRLARRLGVRLVETTGSVVQDVPALVGLLAGLREGDMLFLDEIHAVPRATLESLYQAMSDRRIPLTWAVGLAVRTVALDLAPFTLVAATTEEADLPRALHSRFAVREHLGWYEPDALATIAREAALGQACTLEPDAARVLAGVARGTPREVLRLLDRVLDLVAGRRGVAGLPLPLTREDVERSLAVLGYDAAGLHPDEQRYLRLLREHGAPVSLARMAGALGLPVRTLLEHIEPRLVLAGLVRITPQGRVPIGGRPSLPLARQRRRPGASGRWTWARS